MNENETAEIFMAVCAIPTPELEPGVVCATMTTGRNHQDPDD